MRLLSRITLLALVLTIASSAFAIDYPCADNETDCGGFVSDESNGGDNMGSYKPPSTDTCSARRAQGQACRTCVAAIYDNGQWTGYAVCGFVEWSAHCSCKGSGTDACQNQGSCTYIY